MAATDTIATIRRFLALPVESLPKAEYVADDGFLHPWSALRCAVSRRPERQDMAIGCGAIRLRADRDEWRSGVIVTL